MILATALALIGSQFMAHYSVTMVDLGDASPGRVQMNANDELAVTTAPAGEDGTFYWSEGHLTRIEIPESSDFSGYVVTTGISDKGTIVGYWRNNFVADGPGFKWSATGGMSVLRWNDSDADYWAQAIGKSNEEIVGIPVGSESPALGTLSSSRFTPRTSVIEDEELDAPAINCHDVIVGTKTDDNAVQRAFRIVPGEPILSLPVPSVSNPGEECSSSAVAINDSGYVVGFTFSGRHGRRNEWSEGAIWSPKNELTRVHDAEGLQFLGINNQGLVVGRKGVANNTRAILFDSKSGLWDLNALVPSGTPVLTHAYAINDRGTIVCSAENGHLYLLRPISG